MGVLLNVVEMLQVYNIMQIININIILVSSVTHFFAASLVHDLIKVEYENTMDRSANIQMS